ncbi:MAG: bacteriohopanetetrol glucosamine biosynthesis glycosyltransferase HpnI [Thermoanaerobaculia bacterium]
MVWTHLSHPVAVVTQVLLFTICGTSAAYYLLTIHAAREFFKQTRLRGRHLRPPISILKPVKGLDRDAYENFASFCRQTYPRYQVIFGAQSESEPGIAVARRIARDFPDIDIDIVVSARGAGLNPKVAILGSMMAVAKHPILLVSDSDIRVGPAHLETVVGTLADPEVGVVTCLYRSHAAGLPGTLDALGLSTEFQPSVLVARRLEGVSFAMGSGILIRRSALDAIGGFHAVADYLADDYLLGNLPSRMGYRVELSEDVVEHRLGTASLSDLVQHQIRWNRGIRSARPWGYAGLLFTQGIPAALLLALLGGSVAATGMAGLALVLRLAMAWYVAVRCLRDPLSRRFLWLVPLRDLLGFGLWLSAFFGHMVDWRGSRFRLGPGGRLLAEPTPPAETLTPRRAVSW